MYELQFRKQVIKEPKTSTPPFTDIHGPLLYEGTSKHEDLFESWTVHVTVCALLCAGVSISPMGQQAVCTK